MRILVLILFALTFAAQAGAAERWALVLGIGAYEHPEVQRLPNTVNDARTIAASLTNMGFQVYLLENGTKAEIEAAVRDIREQQVGAQLGLFFFAGHGLQEAGNNYMLPVDVDPAVPDFLDQQAVSIGALVAGLRGATDRNLVVILDSCRNSLIGQSAAFGTGLALTDAPDNTIIAYSTAPGAVALDGSGFNSPFTAALASALEGPPQDLRDVLRLVRAKVRLATGGAQTPWFIDNSRSEIVIQPREEVALPGRLRDVLSQGTSLATTAWRTIATSSDVNDFEQFAALFPGSALSEVAREQAAALRDAGGPRMPPMEIPLPDPNAVIPGGLDSQITVCDLLATPVRDQFGLVDPVPSDLVNTRAAIRACLDAVANNPEDPRLLAYLGRVLALEERYVEANYYYEAAVARGNHGAYAGLADAYRFGRGVPVDLEKAVEYAQKGALRGVIGLRTTLANYYRNGWGVPQSYSEARRWLQLASDFGGPGGTVALGDLYRRGEGVPKDPAVALSYYRKAAAVGWTDAMNHVGMAYMRGEGTDRDFGQGIAWLSQASEQGNPYAAFYLGRAFREGWGVERDPQQAMAFFRLSAQRNFIGAYIAMGEMLLGEDGLSADLPQAYANFTIAAEAARAIDTVEARAQAGESTGQIDAMRARMSPAEALEGERLAKEWIEQYGVTDFTRVWE